VIVAAVVIVAAIALIVTVNTIDAHRAAVAQASAVAQARMEAEASASASQAAAEASASAKAARLKSIPNAVKTCKIDESKLIVNDEKSVFLDGKGDKAGSGSLTIMDQQCVLNELGAPNSLYTKIGKTRGLDGNFSEFWDDFGAAWTNNPDDGLDILVKVVKK
jgi:hypothetical protein